MHRRQFLFGSSALLAAMGLPAAGLALTPASDRKFIFVFNPGGWDPTRVFATAFGNPNVDMEAAAQRATAGGISYVDHPGRPSVRNFFDAFNASTLVFNGVMVRSIAHEICSMIMMTGSSSGLSPDWPTLIGHAARAHTTLPNLVLGGPSFPGDLGVAVARTGNAGQLEALLSGQAFDMSDIPVNGPSRPVENVIDRYIQRRTEARVLGARSTQEAALTADLHASMQKLGNLKDLRYTMDFSGSGSLADQSEVAAQALSLGVSRSVCMSFTGGSQFGWDTHGDNDNTQSPLWESLFSGLVSLMATLRATPGTKEATLADETTVVVLSEMGRTPKLNEVAGKDHWPYTSVMVVSPHVTGGRVVGGFDDAYYGKLVDPATGDTTESGQVLSAEAIGATLLALADVDPEEHISGVAPITGVLA
jgi:hypothetical protein